VNCKLPITSRPYDGDADLARIKDLLMAGRAVSPHSGYMHLGDLEWRLYYGQRHLDRSQLIQLWQDASSHLLGFLIFDGPMFECYVLPDQRGSLLEVEMVHWAEARARQAIVEQGGLGNIITYSFADDARWIAVLEDWGYVKADQGRYVYLARSIIDPLPEPSLLAGFTLRGMAGEGDIEQRAEVHRNAFLPSRMTADAYRALMSAPGYLADLDSVVVASDGSFAAFAMAWLDPRSRIGEFEPIGTRSSFRRMGLGRAVLLRGMERMRLQGMEQAIVYADADNEAAIRLYQSVGFEIVNSFCDYIKRPTG
jgi:mycothiol synthase